MLETFRKLCDLLEARERRNALLVFSLMLMMGLLEAAGVASIMPFIAVLLKPDIVRTNKYLGALHSQLGFSTTDSFLFFLAATAFLVVVGRIAFSALTEYAVVRFATMRSYAFTMRLLEGYLRQPYAWFLYRHSSDLAKTMLLEVDSVIKGSLMPSLGLIARFIVALCIVTVLIAVDPVIAVTTMLVLGGAYMAVYKGIGNYLRRIGKDRYVANQERFQIAQEVLGGIKEVKVSGLEAAYLQRFRSPAHRFARRRAASEIIGQLPRHFFEALAIGGMLIVVMALLARSEGDLSKVFPIVGLYTFAGMRLLPALQEMYSNLTKISFDQNSAREAAQRLGRRSGAKGGFEVGWRRTPTAAQQS